MIGCDSVFYFPDRKIRGNPAEKGVAHEDVYFHAADGTRLHGWFLPAEGSPRGTVLHLHGNAANITAHAEFIDWLPAVGYSVLTFDYRGYGRSGGRVTRMGTLLDAEAALDYLNGRTDVDRRAIVVFGQSIGGAVSVVVAARRRDDIAGLVVDSAFTGYREIARHHVTHNALFLLLGWWMPLVMSDGPDPVDHIGQVSPRPVLVMHGRQDRIVPWEMGRRLYEAAGEPKEWWLSDDTNHMEVWFSRPAEARRRLLKFLEAARPRTGG